MVHVQAILFASLATSLFAAFLAMLGKQWLNHYDSSGGQGSAIRRGQNRQRKLNGVNTWYFTYAMESLPLMLQAALLLLGSALSRYLWEVSTIVAWVVLGVTLFGVFSYLFITIAGAASESCPYQTPWSLPLHYLGSKVPGVVQYIIQYRRQMVPGVIQYLRQMVPGVIRYIKEDSTASSLIKYSTHYFLPSWLGFNIISFLGVFTLMVPLAFAFDFIRFVGAPAYHLIYRVYHHLHSGNGSTKTLDLWCISWTIQTTLDESVWQAAINHLGTRLVLELDPTLIIYPCFDALTSCLHISDQEVAVKQGKEQFAKVFAECFLQSLYHLHVMGPPSIDLLGIRQRYNKVFTHNLDFMHLSFHHTMSAIHGLVNESGEPHHIQWNDYIPSRREHASLTKLIVNVAQARYQKVHLQISARSGSLWIQHQKVPRWMLCFALYSLSLDPPPPASVIADCLTIVAIDLDCDVLNTKGLEER